MVLNGTSPRLTARLRAGDPANLRLCSITKAELLYGARHSQKVVANLRLLEVFFSPFLSLPFDDRCAEHYGAIRADLAAAGHLIGPNDLLIAATARAHDLVLITHNQREFSRVVGLQVEDWVSPTD
jgi:tRNA(fMet)-specific endonuclease VapC